MQWKSIIGKLVVTGCSALVLAGSSHAVVLTKELRQSDSVEWVTTGLASRAHSDVQVRRLMGLFAARKIDPESLYQRLESLRAKQGRR